MAVVLPPAADAADAEDELCVSVPCDAELVEYALDIPDPETDPLRSTGDCRRGVEV